MLTYVVTLNPGQFHDYCRVHRLHPAAAKLVQSPAHLAGVDLDRNRLVFYGKYRDLPEIDSLLDLLVDTRGRRAAPVPLPRERPSYGRTI